MGAFRTIVAGGIVAGAGAALRVISDIIFSTFGETSGPVPYAQLVNMSSTALLGLGGLIAAVGVVQLLYRVWERRERKAHAGRGAERRDGRGGQQPQGQQGGRERSGQQRREPRSRQERRDRSR